MLSVRHSVRTAPDAEQKREEVGCEGSKGSMSWRLSSRDKAKLEEDVEFEVRPHVVRRPQRSTACAGGCFSSR